jgi:hypothetical protein
MSSRSVTSRLLSVVLLLCAIALGACRDAPDGGDIVSPPSQNQPSTVTPGSDQSGEEVTATAAEGNQPPATSGQETALPTPGIVVSEVSGNTAAFNATAEFFVQLESAPTAAVTIPVASTNEAEGVTEQAELIFTQENWFQPQIVVIRGTNEAVQNGEQDYQITLGPAVSSDPLYNGLDPEDIALRGIELTLSEPDNLNGFVANIPATVQPEVKYTGNNLLSFSLTEAPANMSIDLSTGLIRWAPQEADEGQSYPVGVSVNDGSRFAEINFQVTVVAPQPLAVEIEGNTLRVVDSSSTLNGMTITQLDGEPSLAQLNLGKLAIDAVPQIPGWVTAISDVFVVRGSFDQAIELRFPLDGLPEAVSIGDVDVHAFTEAIDVEGQFWSPVFIETSYEGTSDSPTIVVELGGLEGLAVWGYSMPENNSPATSENRQRNSHVSKVATQPASPTAQTGVSCVQQLGPEPDKLPLGNYVCTASQLLGSQTITTTITITGWGDKTTRWTRITKEQLVSYLLAAQTWFFNHDLGFDTTFNVAIHQIDDDWGYVTADNQEQRKTIHLTKDDTPPSR